RVMSQLANSFERYEQTEVHLVLLSDHSDFYTVNNDVIIHRLGYKGEGVVRKIISEFRTLFKLRKILKVERPDVILSFMIKYNVLTIIAALGLRLKVFVSERNNPYRNYGKMYMFLEKLLYRY